MKRKMLVSTLLTAAMAVSLLAGCGKDEGSSGGGSQP